LRKNKRPVYRIYAALIEEAHDIGIAMNWPGIEPVGRGTCLNFNLLRSAAEQPYQECFGRELYPTLAAKASYLFVHIATAHIFSNGNKRTAALCLDAFLLMNSQFLTLSNDEVHDLAQRVASGGENGEKFSDLLAYSESLIAKNMLPLSAFRTLGDMAMYRFLHRRKRAFRESELNKADATLSQSNSVDSN
jgi:death-on-curing protein